MSPCVFSSRGGVWFATNGGYELSQFVLVFFPVCFQVSTFICASKCLLVSGKKIEFNLICTITRNCVHKHVATIILLLRKIENLCKKKYIEKKRGRNRDTMFFFVECIK